jgi:hypothetical protein
MTPGVHYADGVTQYFVEIDNDLCCEGIKMFRTFRRVHVILLVLLTCSAVFAEEEKDPAKLEVAAFEKTALEWVGSFGTRNLVRLQEQMEAQRNRVIEVGEPAIPHLLKLLEHKQVNVRRGSAIALNSIVRNNKTRDRKLLKQVLLRMVEDDDIKARSNLYHVANQLIGNLNSKEELSKDAAEKPGR